MPSTQIPTCPLCGLRFSARSLLDLHIREDHQERRPTTPDRDDPGDTLTSQVRTGGPSRGNGPTSGQPRTTDEMITMTAIQRPRSGRAMTALRRVIGTLRYVNDELTRASESIIRSARAPQPGPRPSAPAGNDAPAASAAKHADRAA